MKTFKPRNRALAVLVLAMQTLLLTDFFVLPAIAQPHQFRYTVADGTVTITGYSGPGGEVAIPHTIEGLTVTRIRDYAFISETSLTGIVIPDSVTNIGAWAFSNCTSLTNATIGSSVESIGEAAFQWCGGLTSITLPDSLTSIGDWAFGFCSGLTSLMIGNSVTNIGQYAFVECSGLNSLVIPDSVTSIGNSAFDGCFGLASVTIGNGVTSIGNSAFNLCTGLTSIVIPDGVTSVGLEAFAHCTGLKAVYFEGSVPDTDDLSLFQGSPATIYYLPEATEWGAMYSGRPTALWLPRLGPVAGQSGGDVFEFGVTVHWARGKTVRVESAIDPTNPAWTPLATLRLADGSASFTDPDSPNAAHPHIPRGGGQAHPIATVCPSVTSPSSTAFRYPESEFRVSHRASPDLAAASTCVRFGSIVRP